jgi:hypothetical protein
VASTIKKNRLFSLGNFATLDKEKSSVFPEQKCKFCKADKVSNDIRLPSSSGGYLHSMKCLQNSLGKLFLNQNLFQAALLIICECRHTSHNHVFSYKKYKNILLHMHPISLRKPLEDVLTKQGNKVSRICSISVNKQHGILSKKKQGEPQNEFYAAVRLE